MVKYSFWNIPVSFTVTGTFLSVLNVLKKNSQKSYKKKQYIQNKNNFSLFFKLINYVNIATSSSKYNNLHVCNICFRVVNIGQC